jgi:hypothetical protein
MMPFILRQAQGKISSRAKIVSIYTNFFHGEGVREGEMAGERVRDLRWDV